MLSAGSLLAIARAGRAQEDVPDLTDLTIEALANVDIVYAASKHEQSSREAPSSVTIVTAAQIQRMGYRTLADILRSVPGFYVTDDRNYSYVGVRGFGRPGDYSTRILLLVDGARVNDAVYDQAPIGEDFLVDVEMMERVEVVRGPGSSIHGNSAFFAVINVVTRAGRDLRGGEASAAVGAFGTHATRAAWGRRFADGSEAAVSASFHETAGERLYYPELDQPENGSGVTEGTDDERVFRLFGSLAWRGFTLEALHVDRDKGIPTGSYGTVFDDPRNRTSDARTLVQLRHQRHFGVDFSSDFRIQHGRYDYRGVYVYSDETSPIPLNDQAYGRWWAANWNGRWQAGKRQAVTFGGELQWSPRQDQIDYYETPADPGTNSLNRSSRWALYVQDEVRLSSRVMLHAGLRHDHYQTFGDHLSPRASLVWLPDSMSAVKLLYGQAFRAPNEYELHYWTTQTGGLRPETIKTYELVGDRLLGSEVRVTASLFYNQIDDLISFTSTGDFPSPQDGYRFENMARVDSRGAEIGLDARLGGWGHAIASYSLQETRDRNTDAELSNSPHHLVKGSLTVNLPRKGSLAIDAIHTSRRLLLGGGAAPGATVANATLRLPRVLGPLDLSLSAYNLLDARYADPGSEEHLQQTIPRPRRALLVRLSASF